MCFLASGERVTTLDPDEYDGKSAREVKQSLAARVDVSRFRQRLFAESGQEIRDHEVLTLETAKVYLVKLELCQADREQVAEMVRAAKNNDVAALEPFLQEPLDPHVKGDREDPWAPWGPASPWHYAAAMGNVEVMQLLLEADTDIDFLDNPRAGETALGLAARQGHLHAVRWLLDMGADKDLFGWGVEPPVTVAAAANHVDVVSLLLDRGAKDDYDCFPLLSAAEQGSLEVVRFLLDMGFDKNRGNNMIDGTALCVAAKNGHLDVARLLLEVGADKDACNTNGATALFAAASVTWILCGCCLTAVPPKIVP